MHREPYQHVGTHLHLEVEILKLKLTQPFLKLKYVIWQYIYTHTQYIYPVLYRVYLCKYILPKYIILTVKMVVSLVMHHTRH